MSKHHSLAKRRAAGNAKKLQRGSGRKKFRSRRISHTELTALILKHRLCGVPQAKSLAQEALNGELPSCFWPGPWWPEDRLPVQRGTWQSRTDVEEARNLLGLAAVFSRDDLKTAFRQAAFEAHPDTGGTHSSFIVLMEAAALLKKHAVEECVA